MFLAAVVSALGVVVLCLVIACCRLRHKRQAQSRNNVSTAPSTFGERWLKRRELTLFEVANDSMITLLEDLL